jgi:spermidine synthase
MKRGSVDIALPPATVSEEDGVRYLHLGTPWVQGAMRIRKPQVIELDYVQRMMVWMLMRSQADVAHGHAVQLGLGAASITRFTHKVLRMRTTAVELNPTVIGVCRIWFHLPPDDRRLTVVHRDAASWVADPINIGCAQVLNVDLYDHDAASPALDSAPFYAACHQILAEPGVMTVNLFGRNASFERSAARIVAAFGETMVWSLRPTREGTAIVLASKGIAMPDRATLAVRAECIESRFALPARKWLRMIRPMPSLPETVPDPRTSAA